jgi:hypothetical protein
MGVGMLVLWALSECFLNNENLESDKAILVRSHILHLMCFGTQLARCCGWGVSILCGAKAGIDFIEALGLENLELNYVRA